MLHEYVSDIQCIIVIAEIQMEDKLETIKFLSVAHVALDFQKMHKLPIFGSRKRCYYNVPYFDIAYPILYHLNKVLHP